MLLNGVSIRQRLTILASFIANGGAHSCGTVGAAAKKDIDWRS